MKCPYCEEEMSIGYIHNGNQPIQWLPSGKKPSIFRFSAVEDGVKLNSKLSLKNFSDFLFGNRQVFLLNFIYINPFSSSECFLTNS